MRYVTWIVAMFVGVLVFAIAVAASYGGWTQDFKPLCGLLDGIAKAIPALAEGLANLRTKS